MDEQREGGTDGRPAGRLAQATYEIAFVCFVTREWRMTSSIILSLSLRAKLINRAEIQSYDAPPGKNSALPRVKAGKSRRSANRANRARLKSRKLSAGEMRAAVPEIVRSIEKDTID